VHCFFHLSRKEMTKLLFLNWTVRVVRLTQRTCISRFLIYICTNVFASPNKFYGTLYGRLGIFGRGSKFSRKNEKEDGGVCSMDGDRLLGLAFPSVKKGVHMFAYLKLGCTTCPPIVYL